MNIQLAEYKPIHAFEILDKGVREAELLLSMCGDWESAAKAWYKSGPAYTLFIDGEPIACGGVSFIDTTMGECWALIPVKKNGIIIFRYILKVFEDLIKKHKFRRLQAHVIKDFKAGERLMEKLDFEFEGWLRHYGPNNETFGCYARIF